MVVWYMMFSLGLVFKPLLRLTLFFFVSFYWFGYPSSISHCGILRECVYVKFLANNYY